MRCPFCSFVDTQVKDSRPSEDHQAIRRRRLCPECGSRFTTFERIELMEIVIVKKNGDREPFDREKLTRSVSTALRKRPIDTERIQRFVSSLVRKIELTGEPEMRSAQVGELVLNGLKELDQVAYLRFASVYLDFEKPEDFSQLIQSLESAIP